MTDQAMDDRPHVQDLIAAFPLPTLVIDPAEQIIAVNDAAVKMMGPNAAGRHFTATLRNPKLVDAIERGLREPAPQSISYQGIENGNDIHYDVHLQQIGQTGRLLVSLQNVEGQAQAEQMRRDFIANVSHELRTPLTGMIGFIETLRTSARDDARARDKFLGTMAREAERMNRLVHDLLSLSRVEAEQRVRPTERLDLRNVMQTTLRNLDRLAIKSNVTLKPDLGEEPLLVIGEMDQLLQVFTNLLENAMKYGGADKSVEITSQIIPHDPVLRGPAIGLTIADHGPGIDPIHIPRLTERFYRADSHRSRELGGTGLGLAIVKHILNRHRGRLKISSEPGQGAKFTVILPPAQI
ncbi:sensor histidine kinase [Pseudorhodobacter aquimaris]|uniref:sensor histidine kinase n=1 Tax=Pseudorhodobacter aquimaris TaxID=687412 RepID=UPI00067D54A3|nr:ATP-binding protein [Pseudorhodobacter aquimaris]